MTVMVDRWSDARTQIARDTESSLLALLTMAAVVVAIFDVLLVVSAL